MTPHTHAVAPCMENINEKDIKNRPFEEIPAPPGAE